MPKRQNISPSKGPMKRSFTRIKSSGKIGWALLWLLGIPIPVLLVVFMLRGCT